MEILPLGVGEAFAKTLNQTNFLIAPAAGEAFLVDFGQTAPRALFHLGVDPCSLSGVLLSHLHADHIGGLEELGFSGYFAWGRRPVLYVPEDLLPFLWPCALEAGMGQRLRDPQGRLFDADLSTYFEVRTVEGTRPFRIGSVEITSFPTPHILARPSWGFRLHDLATGGKVTVTCDTRFQPQNVEEHGAEAEVIFHDCRLTSSTAEIHATLEELLTLPERWQEKILLVHYGDDWRSYKRRIGRMRFAREGETYRF